MMCETENAKVLFFSVRMYVYMHSPATVDEALFIGECRIVVASIV